MLSRFVTFFSELVGSGRATSRKIYLTPFRGSGTGMLVLEGEIEFLNGLFWSKDYKRLHVEAGRALVGFVPTIAVGGEPEAVRGPAALFAEVTADQ